ncbi:MAG: helix-turn-helix domain-containing protein [Pyramidobacter sp.]|nr:helix-turn-helix domain-containing protein [Pyramidobacter sp.]
MDKETCYKALCSHDSRFDGTFFVGVASTGVYCRPVCRVRTPKYDGCTFFRTAAEAERAGYRPCLKCRPELAPGASLLEAGSNLARAAAAELEASCGDGESLEELARRLGCASRHLRRAFENEFHVSPLQFRQTCRLLLAKKLLTDTDLSVLDVALASGFGSLRRFNTVFGREYRLTPSALRKARAGGVKNERGVVVEVGCRAPYRWDEILAFLAPRAIPGVETVRDGKYCRTVSVKERSGWLTVERRQERGTLAVAVSESLLRVLPHVLVRVRKLFDADSDPQLIAEALQSMAELDERLPLEGLRVPGCFDAFETAVRAVLGQQITVTAATTLAGRVAQAFGTEIETGAAGLNTLFPQPSALLRLPDAATRMGELGVIGARAAAIVELARLFSCGHMPSREELLAIKGIGPWTADYIAMRAYGTTDAFLSTDHAVRRALAPRTPKEALALAERWRPWRSYAVMNLWALQAREDRT